MQLPHTYALLLMGLLIQSPPAPDLAPPALIDQLVANAEQYRLRLPSLTADETISSEVSYRGIFPSRLEAQGTFRVTRAAEGERVQESRQITSVKGKPVGPGKHVKLPFTLFGGFGLFQEMFFTTQHRSCFEFKVLKEPGPNGTLQLTVTGLPAAPPLPNCPAVYAGVTGLVLVDPATHQLAHFERTVTLAPGVKSNLAPFASVDCAPTRVGDDTYWLPTQVVGRSGNGSIRGQFLAHYSNYHRYTASIKLLPGAVEVDPSSTPEPAAPPASTPQ